MQMRKINQLTGLYSLSKTLRFELKPVGKTLEHIESKGLIAQDEKRAEEYKKVKNIIDDYHKSEYELPFLKASIICCFYRRWCRIHVLPGDLHPVFPVSVVDHQTVFCTVAPDTDCLIIGI